MKEKRKPVFQRAQWVCISFIFLLLSLNLSAQNTKSISGTITDETGEPVIGASISVKGTSIGTSTDVNGNFLLTVEDNVVLTFQYLGYTTQEMPVAGKTIFNIVLKENTKLLSEVVVIGYGSVKKSDMTGSVVAIKAEEMNKGITTSPQDLLVGKVAGVSVINSGGQPGGGAAIRIRGGSSLSANNDPLIVIDGVIMGNSGVDGLSNPLSTVNPNDIESFSVLKDASSSAIYGSRASNGVIIITTKKGKSGKVKFSYNGKGTISTLKNKYDVLSADELSTYINNNFSDNAAMISALNLYKGQSTDWQNEIYKKAFGMDHSLSAYGSLKNFMPYRASFGYTNEDGILKTSNFKRFSGDVSLSPTLFKNHLKVNINAKGSYIKNRFADTGAIGAAVFFDPTKPVRNGNTKYGGYYAWTRNSEKDGDWIGFSANPLTLLMMRDNLSDVKSFIGSLQFEYKVHFLPDLKLFLNLNTDYSTSDGNNFGQPNAAFGSGYADNPKESGRLSEYGRTNKNKSMDFYGLYAKTINDHRFDLMGGYSYESMEWNSHSETWYLSRDNADYGKKTTLTADPFPLGAKVVTMSFFGRLNYVLKERYLFTATIRDDASSRFSKENRWALFPSVALAWRINEESFLKDFTNLSSLKLRLGWGVTGQQYLEHAANSSYPSIVFVSEGKGGISQIEYDDSGNPYYINVAAFSVANSNLKWEETTTWNIGVDYGFLNNRINGMIDVYKRITKDLLNNEIHIPAGTDFGEFKPFNVGNLENKGIEFAINAIPVAKKDLNWDLGFNITYNKGKITKLFFDDENTRGNEFGSTGGDGAKSYRINSVGYAPGMYYMYEQIYDQSGKPIEGAYVDRNGDGAINDLDKYQYKKPEADVFLGFNSKLVWKNLDVGFNGHASIGNYNYNAIAANSGHMSVTGLFGNNCLSNKPTSALVTNFSERQRLSDYYIQNASFLKIDNITLGYTFNKMSCWKGANLRAYGTVQNPFIFTKYEGLDPEIFGGMDNNLYPRPLAVIFGINLNF